MPVTRVNIGTATGASGATLAVTIPAGGVPAGSLIVVAVTEKSTSGTSGTLADTATNTWNTSQGANLAGLAADGRGTIFFAFNSKALVSGNTITYTRNLSASSCAMSACYFTGILQSANPEDTAARATATGTTGTITVTSGTPANAGDLFVGVLCDSGTSVAGGNATFTQATNWAIPPNEATTGGSGGSRVDGGFRQQTGTAATFVYNPTLSSTAQQWALLITAFRTQPDVADLTENQQRAGRPTASRFDPPNLLLTTLTPSAPVTPTLFRTPLFARLPDPRRVARQEYVANLLPFRSMAPTRLSPPTVDQPVGGQRPRASSFDPPNLLLTTLATPAVVVDTTHILRSPLFAPMARPRAAAQEYVFSRSLLLYGAPVVTVTFNQDDWPSATLPRTKAGEPALGPSAPLYTPNPSAPFSQDLWEGAALPRTKAVGEPVGRIAPLITPNPARPFTQYEWRTTARVPLSLKSDSYFGAFPLYSPNPPAPFNQDLWENAARALPKAGGETLATLQPAPAPFAQSDWFQVRSTPKAKVDDPYNATIVQPVVVTVVQFAQLDWPSAALPRQKFSGDTSAAPPAPLLTPNPAQPFSQDLWDLAIRAFPKATGEAIGTLSPILTPNPRQPFVQYEWRPAARVPLSLKSESFWGALPLYAPNPSVPFNQDLWESAAKPWSKVIGEALGTLAPLLTPNPAQPFGLSDWTRILTARPAKVDDVINLLPLQTAAPVVFAPFYQNDWLAATRARPAQQSEVYRGSLALLAPNPPQPFNQNLWDSATKSYPKAGGEVTGTLSPILTPNPRQPFAQRIWDLATPPKPKAYADPAAAISALYNPNPSRPFSQYIWDSATRAWPKAVGEATGGILALLAPNPARPFNQSDWTRIPATSKARVDDFVNLVPLYSVVVVQPPFYYRDEDARSFSIARARPPQKSDVYGVPNPLLRPNPSRPFHQNLWDSATQLPRLKALGDVLAPPNPIIFPNPSRPFRQADWPSSARSGPSDRSFAASINLPLITPPPVPPPGPGPGIGAAIGAYPKWRLLSGRQTGLPTTPTTAYVNEDGVTVYVTEDGATVYIPE